MSWSYNTGDQYHTQDTSYYCGAACAMMILHEIGVPYSALDQDDLYASNHNHNAVSSWYTDPYGLCYTLNARRPAAFLPNFFVVYKPTTEAEGTRHVIYTLRHYNVSPAILVYNCAHWNVVCGVQTDVDPAGGTYTVEGFWLNNPVWDSSLSSHDGSDTCGSGGSHGVANEFVTYSEWQTNRFNGCSYDAPGGATQWVSVCDPTPPEIELPRAREIRYHADGKSILPAEAAIGLARRGIEEYRVLDNERSKALSGRGDLGKPVLVQRLDRPGEFYYIVPWESDGRVSGTVDIDARFGTFKSARVLSRPAESWLGSADNSIARQSIGRLIDGHAFELPEERGRFKVFPDTYCVPSTLVWKPCRQSWSPHLPFHHIVIGGYSLYVRIDGHVFTQLTSGRGV
jgi:hypothetical protein